MGTNTPLWRFAGVRPTAFFFFAYLYLPIVVLLVLSFNENRTATIWTTFSTHWYGAVLDNDNIIRAARNSVIVATSATVMATILATLAALGMARSRFRGQDAVSAVIAMPLVVSAWLAEGDEPDKLDVLRRNADKGLPCGSEKFIRKLEKLTGRALRYRPRGRPKKGDDE